MDAITNFDETVQHRVQRALERILYIWALRHPASGYVQGLNDLVTPFLAVFLSETLFRPADGGQPPGGEDAEDGAGSSGRADGGAGRPAARSARDHRKGLGEMEDWDIDSVDEREIFNAEVCRRSRAPRSLPDPALPDAGGD